MPKLNDVAAGGPDLVEVPSLDWLQEAVSPGLARGSVYLVAGEPGLGKTTLGIQALGDLAGNGTKVLYITTEQSLGDIKCAVQRIHGNGDGSLPQALCDNFYFDASIEDVEALPRLLTRKVLTSGAEYHGAEVVVVDSVQGRGLAPTATKKYRALYRFTEGAKAQGLLTFLLSHVTKRGQIAGPKELEHNVDCVVFLRRAFRLRPLFVPKNRLGPTMLDPLVLMMDDRGRLVRSPHSTAQSVSAMGYSGVGDELAESQASVRLPRYGSRPTLNSPYLPAKKVRQLISVLSAMQNIDLTDMSYEINCYLPGRQAYCHELDLPIAVALLASYLRQALAERTLFVGELDLTRRIRPPSQGYLVGLGLLLAGPQRGHIDTVYISEDAAADLRRMRLTPNGPPVMELVDVCGVGELEGLLRRLWPAVFSQPVSS